MTEPLIGQCNACGETTQVITNNEGIYLCHPCADVYVVNPLDDD